jgi:hypothetical protein
MTVFGRDTIITCLQTLLFGPELARTALHALAALDRRVSSVVHERCLDFIDTLWSSEGGFHGHWADEHLDAEYTYYGLLALGHLSL